MVKNSTIKCVVCGKEYRPCLTCERLKNHFVSWRLIADTANHYKIYMIVKDFLDGNASREESAALLESVDLTGVESFYPSIREAIHKIQQTEIVDVIPEPHEEIVSKATQKKNRKKTIEKKQEDTE